jgi:hypothetical protein
MSIEKNTVINNMTLKSTLDWHEDLGSSIFVCFSRDENGDILGETPELYYGSGYLEDDFDDEKWTHFIDGDFNFIFSDADPINVSRMIEQDLNSCDPSTVLVVEGDSHSAFLFKAMREADEFTISLGGGGRPKIYELHISDPEMYKFNLDREAVHGDYRKFIKRDKRMNFKLKQAYLRSGKK